MKEPWSISKDKLVALEEGTSCNEEHECAKPAGRSNVCKQAIQCIKLILYLEVLMIVGWACYSIWQPYHAQPMEVKVTDVIREPESQNLLLLQQQLQEQPTHETSTIAARPFYGSENSLKTQDAVADLQIFLPDDQDEIFNSENTETSLGWPTDYPDLPEAMNFSFFLPSISSMKVDEREKELGSSESAQRLFDISIYNISEESQQLERDEITLLENYMLLSLLVQNAVRISEASKNSKEVVDPKLEFELEDLDRLQFENTGPLEWENSSRLELDSSDPFEWFSYDRFESPKEIGSDLKDSEEKPISTQTDDNHESASLNILNNTHEIVPEDSTESEEETLIKSNEQMPQSMDSGEKEGKHEEEQPLLEKSAIINAEALKDYSEEVDQNVKLRSAFLDLLKLVDSSLLKMVDSGPSEFEDVGPLEWEDSVRLASKDLSALEGEDSGPLESQKEIGSDLEDSEEKPSSTQTDDNYESATLNVLSNTHEIVPEDSTEPKQEETLIKSNEQMHQSMDFGVVDWFHQMASEKRKHEEEQATETIASDETEAEIEDDEIPQFPFDFRDSSGNTYRHHSGFHSDTSGSSLENESDDESQSDSFDWGTYYSLLKQAQSACFEKSIPWELVDHEDINNSYDRGVLDRCNEHAKTLCDYWERTLKLTDCSKYNLVRRRAWFR